MNVQRTLKPLLVASNSGQNFEVFRGLDWSSPPGGAPGSTITNVEIKAICKSPRQVRAIARTISDSKGESLHQEDIFFDVFSGRLKLRIFDHTSGELIHYHRSNVAGPRPSHYAIAKTRNPHALKAILSSCFAVKGTVRKHRMLFRVGQTRIHLDSVRGLGDFVELEFVLRKGQSQRQGLTAIRRLMAILKIDQGDLVSQSYLDLLAAQ